MYVDCFQNAIDGCSATGLSHIWFDWFLICLLQFGELTLYRIAQNFGRVNFWRLVARHAIGGGNLANPAQLVFTSPYTLFFMFKIWREKF